MSTIRPEEMSRDQVREHAYEVWRAQGQHIVNTEKALAKEGFKITRQTIAAWRDEFGWCDRAAREVAAAQQQNDEFSDEGILSALLSQKAKYEAYFESLPLGQVDNQAVYAYSSLLKTIVDLRPKQIAAEIDRPKVFMEDLQFIAETLKEIDPEGLKVLGRNFDELTKRFKNEHA